MPTEYLLSFLAEPEAADFYRVGEDNAFTSTRPASGVEFLFCHELDIHFISDDAEFIRRLKAEWNYDGLSPRWSYAQTSSDGHRNGRLSRRSEDRRGLSRCLDLQTVRPQDSGL